MNSSKDQPQSNWPEEVKKAYEALKIPSLYDCVLINEKLSLEIHKQNREIKELIEKIGVLTEKLQAALNILKEVEVEDYDEEMDVLEEGKSSMPSHLVEMPQTYVERGISLFPEIDDSDKAIDILLDTNDLIIELSKKTKQSSQQLIEILPKKEGLFKTTPPWNKLAEDFAVGITTDLNTARYALITFLEEMNIQTIDPKPGEVYAADKHHVLEKISGGQSGTIAQLIRVGYEQLNEVLRPAEVVIYA